jgi:hypothetical protein
MRKLAITAVLMAAVAAAAHAQVFTNATKLRGAALCNPLTATDAQVLTWSAANNCWGPASAGASPVKLTSQTVTAGSTFTLTHNLHTKDVMQPTCYITGSDTSITFGWDGRTIDTISASNPVATTTVDCIISTGGVGRVGDPGSTGLTGATGAAGGTIVVTNDTGTGTTTNSLAKINSSGNAVLATTTDTAIPVFLCISGCGTTGSATLLVGGSGTAQADASGVTRGHFLVNSTATNGRVADGGATAPTSGWVVGIAQSTAAANATFTLLNAPGYNATSGGSTGYHTSCAPTSGAPVVVNLTNDTTVTDLMSCTLASGEFIANSLVTFVASGHMATTASRPCLFFKIGTVIPSSMCLTGGTATFTDFDWEVVARCRVDSAPGASVTMYCSATASTSNNNAWQYFDNAVNPITIATNATIVAKMQTENTNATGNITVTQLNYFAWRSN